MAVESSPTVIDSLLEKLKLDDPWVPPRYWDSLPSQSGAPSRPPSQTSTALYATPTVSEPSLVRLAMNALQGVESALICIEKLSSALRYSSADRTFYRIPSLWIRCSSNVVVGNLLTSIGQFGCIIFLLRRFVSYFTNLDFIGSRDLKENTKSVYGEKQCTPRFSLINQAFAISVGKIIDGHASALNTLSESVSLRRCLKSANGGCLTSIGNSKVTLLEVYLHTMGLRTQIESLGNLCNVVHLSNLFPESSLEDLRTKADSEFIVFPRSGALLSFLYAQLKVADSAHSALLKFLFLQCYEPYSDFIRSLIYNGEISDPHHEFVVESATDLSIHALGDLEIPSNSFLPIIRVRDGAAAPGFLEECLVPLCRTGHQLQVIIKLLELSNNVGACDTHEEILPSLAGLSSEYPWFTFPLSFDKATIETMVYVRDCYYQRMLEKMENMLAKLNFSSEQATQGVVALKISNKSNHQVSFVEKENLSQPLSVRRDPNVPDGLMGSQTSSIMDESPYAEDLLESSEHSSSESFKETDEAEDLIPAPLNVAPSFLSALDFSLSLSTDRKLQNFDQSDISCSLKDFPSKVNWKSGYAAYHSHKEACLATSEQKVFRALENHVSSTEDDLHLFYDHNTDRGRHDTWPDVPDCGLELNMDYGLVYTDSNDTKNASRVSTSSANQHHCPTRSPQRACNLKYDSTYFSMNPTRNRGSFHISRTMLGERGHASFMNSHFDFTSVEDPLRACTVKLAGDHGITLKNEGPQRTEFPTARVHASNPATIKDLSDDVIVKNDATLCIDSSSLHKKDSEGQLFQNTTGGSAWESLLGRSQKSFDRSLRDHRTLLVPGSDMPLDFVIKRCVLDEISLQYKYLSKLTIKLLTEGFKLQEHLQSLRYYHFMEVADWVDLFIMSLWLHFNQKWDVSEVDKRIPEIQGVLELAIQRSSCEGDPNKDRLYVYWKGDGSCDLAASAKGIHCLDSVGLGYRISWPISIILSPAALEIYSEIFNFLIQVKLSIFSLNEAWASLKVYHMEPQKGQKQNPILTETRHKVYHFVSALQQYVQSQLSQESWFRFLVSLKHKVKDMLDLESVHMSYLMESQHICFLSNETRPIARIIQNMLQSAMEFRSCLTRSPLRVASNGDDKPTNKCSQADFSQVHNIRSAFTKNLKDLHLIYLQSPKHGEFGIHRFWDYLNYNQYYEGGL